MAKTKPTVQTGTLPSGVALASDALTYQGAAYTWGGRADRPGDWDCSSCMSYVLGHDFGLTLPGGGKYGDPGYPPNSHGPDVASYLAWDGATTLGKSEAPQPGDLVLWGPNEHIGMYVGNGSYFSALDTHDGSITTTVAGGGGSGTPIYRRINGIGQTPSGIGGVPGAASSALAGGLSAVVGPAVAGVLLTGGFIVVVLGVVIVGGVITAAALAAILSRARSA